MLPPLPGYLVKAVAGLRLRTGQVAATMVG
jgi:hypothetical protein